MAWNSATQDNAPRGNRFHMLSVLFCVNVRKSVCVFESITSYPWFLYLVFLKSFHYLILLWVYLILLCLSLFHWKYHNICLCDACIHELCYKSLFLLNCLTILYADRLNVFYQWKVTGDMTFGNKPLILGFCWCTHTPCESENQVPAIRQECHSPQRYRLALQRV